MPVSPTLSDASIKHSPRLLAEAVRELLDASPSDLLAGQPCGTLKVQRAWLPIFKLKDQTEICITVLAGDDSGELLDRRLGTNDDIEVNFSVQQLLQTTDTQSEEGKQEIDAIVDFAERVLRAAFTRVTDANGRVCTPITFERTLDDDALQKWNQVSVLFSITYRGAS